MDFGIYSPRERPRTKGNNILYIKIVIILVSLFALETTNISRIPEEKQFFPLFLSNFSKIFPLDLQTSCFSNKSRQNCRFFVHANI